MKPIDADYISQMLEQEYHGMISDESMKIYKIIQMLEDTPVLDVAPVKHGYWIWGKAILNRQTCSCCKSYFDMLEADNYCPSCGAKMDLEEQ